MLIVLVGLLFGGVVGGIAVIMLRTDPGHARAADPPDPMVDAVAAYVSKTAGGAVSEADAICMARSILDSVGRPRLVEVGAEEGADLLAILSPEEIQLGLPLAMECLDNASAEAMIARTLKPIVLASFNVQDADCVAHGWMQSLGRETLIRIYALWAARQGATLTQALDGPQLQSLAAVLATCGTPTPASQP